ncbi:hect-domain (ubiquitin-transferase) domain-containing protein, partial [Cystoisospora suis]
MVFTCGDHSQGCLGLGGGEGVDLKHLLHDKTATSTSSAKECFKGGEGEDPAQKKDPMKTTTPNSSYHPPSDISSSSSSLSSVSSLVVIPSLYAVPIRQVAAGAQHVIALTISGDAFTWGKNKDG